MLAIAETKFCRLNSINAFAENLPFADNFVDLVAISFGVRNFSNLEKSFKEIYRILKNKGVISIMEFSIPKFFLLRWGFFFYLKCLMPLLVLTFSKNKQEYKYLQESIIDFGKNTDVIQLLQKNNFTIINKEKMAFGAVSIYTCRKNLV
jgi:demethylmenaquinone methyltransferase/2-methoxy-6-polyprenyl-1,4-benzoquinol methylase